MSTTIARIAGTVAALAVTMGVAAASQDAAARPLAVADAAMQAGRFAEAASQYEVWIRTHPDSRDVLFALGLCYIQLGRQTEAATVLRRYVTLAPQSADGHALLGIALLDAVSTADAQSALTRAMALNPKQANAIEALARLELVEGEPGKAVSLLRPVVSAESGHETRALLGEALLRSGDAAAAAALLDRDLTAAHDATPAVPARDVGASSQADAQPALRPATARPLPQSGAPTQIYALAALARLKSGDLDRAAEICEHGMRLYPDSEIEGVYLTLPPPVLARRTTVRLQRLQASPEVNELIALARVLIDVDPQRQTRALELADRMLAQALAIAPDNASAHYNYGRLHRERDIDRALADWTKALTLNPSDELAVQIYTQIARTRDAVSDLPAAQAAFEAALESNRRLSRRVPEAALEYVRFLQLRSESARAEAVLNEVLGWNPWSPQAHVERARLLAEAGRWEQVIVEGDFVLRNAGDDDQLRRVAHLLLARAYYRLQQPEKAQLHRAWIESH